EGALGPRGGGDLPGVRRAVRARHPGGRPPPGAAGAGVRLPHRPGPRRGRPRGVLPPLPAGARRPGPVAAGRGVRLMARPPLPEEELVARFGPHRNDAPPDGWQHHGPIDREVRTHCCFCGQQCGILLKVAGDRVVGFEPRYDFPFNRGKLCPKGVKRYLQDNHPDRLLDPLVRTPAGFEPVSWDEALGRTVRELRRIQAEHGPDAVAVLGGASLTTEKSYLLGKLARLALGTRHIDYNGRLCMVSAGVGYKKAFGVDRAPNPWSDIPHADVVFV